MKRTPRAERRIAYHEAGHAVAALILGARVHHATIEPNAADGTAGHMRQINKRKTFDPSQMRDKESLYHIVTNSMILLAGPESEFLAAGRRNHHGAGGDCAELAEWACYLTADPAEQGALCEWLRIRTSNLLKQPAHWAAVKAVAACLVREKYLNKNSIVNIVGTAIHDARAAHMGQDEMPQARSQ